MKWSGILRVGGDLWEGEVRWRWGVGREEAQAGGGEMEN